MGNVNVVRPDGSVVTVSEETAKLLSQDFHQETPGEYQTAAEETARREKYSGALEVAKTGLEGIADTLSAGAYGQMRSWGDDEAYRARAQYNPGVRSAAELATLIAPTGWEGAVVKGIGESSAIGAATKLGEFVTERTGSKVLGRAIEGATLGVQGQIANAEVKADPITVESLAESATISGLLNIGVGAVGDRVVGFGERAAARTGGVRKAEETLSRDSAAYNELRDARKAADDEVNGLNREAKSQREAYQKYLENPQELTRTAEGMQKAVNDIAAARIGRGGSQIAEVAGLQAEVDGVRSMLTAGDVQGAAETMQTLYTKISDASAASRISAASRVPKFPQTPTLTEGKALGISLPDDLRGFARMRPETIERLAHNMTGAEKEAVGKLANELGLTATDNAAADLAGIHKTLKEHEDVLSAMEGADAKDSLGGRFFKFAAKKAGSSVGAAMGGGFIGRAAGSAVAEGLVSATIGAKNAVQRTVAEAAAKLAKPAGKLLQELGPVSAYLSRTFPGGHKDPETDLGQLAKNRVAEIASASTTAADNLYHAVQPVIGVNGDVALATHKHALGALQHLAVNMPKDPGFAPHGAGSDWKPSPQDALALAYRLEVLQNPIGAMKRMLAGDAHPAAADALHGSWPALTAEMLGNVVMGDLSDATPEALSGASALSGTPLTASSVGANAMAIQGMYLPGGSAGPSEAPTGPVGRPPKAGRGGVAGSNVTALLNDGM